MLETARHNPPSGTDRSEGDCSASAGRSCAPGCHHLGWLCACTAVLSLGTVVQGLRKWKKNPAGVQ